MDFNKNTATTYDTFSSFDTISEKPADHVISNPFGLNKYIIKARRNNHAYKPSRTLQFTLKFIAKIKIGTLDVILPDHKKLHFVGKEDGPKATLIIHNDRVARKFLTGGRLGFCEAYLDGDWSSPDITTFFELILLNTDSMNKALSGKAWYRLLSSFIHSLNKNSRKGSRKNIYQHYDIGNNFYKEWLDPSMTYSSALWKTGNETLEQAQLEKYKSLAKMLDIQPQHKVLEIGCGWGGFAEYVATHIGAEITCITISEEQYNYATNRIKNNGLDEKVKIVMKDYRDTKGFYDRIASIEMFEAVGEKYWPIYFETIHNRLKKGGKAGLQIITIDDNHFQEYRRSADYIQRYIFPGGMLPSINALKKQTSKANLTWDNYIAFGKDYAKTLNIWNKDFQAAWPKLETQFDTRFKRLWEQYLCYCEAGFKVGTIDVIQLTVNKG
ncbi:MAG: SAM-dependent methyltransferase [Micavibrio sp.]|nr:SAM-dependent methyltransferase [Micavibrio sp.]